MFTLKNFQEKAAVRLLDFCFQALRTPRPQTPILLEAPTGSGKTVIMANVLERLVDELRLQPGLDANVAFIWFAPNTLHLQSYEALSRMYDETKKLHCIQLESLGGNTLLHPQNLLFVNWGSLNNEDRIWRRDNEQNMNLQQLVDNTRERGTKIILIIDEAHLSGFTGKQAIAVRKLISADAEIAVTATPNHRPALSVAIPRAEVVAEELIKKGVKMNPGVNPEKQQGDEVDLYLLRVAMEKRKELKKLYAREVGEEKLNPLVLIQLPSEKPTLSKEDKSKKEVLERHLKVAYNITTNNGKLAVWLSGEKDKDDIEQPNGVQEVMIFKQAIAQGWNCPRATILICYREIGNSSFGIQTVGRILRMPHIRHYKEDALNYGYVFTNIQSNHIIFNPDDSDYFYAQHATRRKEEGLSYDHLLKTFIVNDRPDKGVLRGEFRRIFFNYMEEKYGIQELPEADIIEGEQEVPVVLRDSNRQQLQSQGWEFIIDEHQIPLPSDLVIENQDLEDKQVTIKRKDQRSFAITPGQFSNMFDRFCYEHITRLNRSKSWKLLRLILLEFAEYYLSINEFEVRKIYLYPQNRRILEQDIQHSLERFTEWQRERGNVFRREAEDIWEIPEVRMYSELYEQKEAPLHALQPYFELEKPSGPELKFRKQLEESAEYIQWWYKNGDKGQEHFSVTYTDSSGTLRLFYVDFIIKFTSGTIGLFDTKSRSSDSEAANKHNGLIGYIEKQREEGKRITGGVIIPDTGNNSSEAQFRFSENRIENTDELTGWRYFNPSEL